MADDVVQDDAGFAALMSAAADDASGDKDPAPYGYMTDPVTGEQRPRKTRGRVAKSPSLDELKAERDAAAAETPAAAGHEDRAPQTGRRRSKRGKGEPKEPKAQAPIPQFREGQISKGINKLYRKAGKIIRVMDPAIGQAIIEATKAEDEDDVTVGQAWEEVARTNPRIRRMLMRFIAGGAWGQLVMAHAPILLAILMKDAISKHIPFAKLMQAFLSQDEDGEAPADGTPFDGMQPADMQQMMAVAQQMAEQMFGGGRVVPGKVVDRREEPAADQAAAA